jgi:integrase
LVERKRKVWLSKEEVNRMLDYAQKDGEPCYLLLALMRYGLRVGEITGERGLPGIHVEDIRHNGIWVKGKGYSRGIVQDRLVKIPSWLLERIRKIAPKEGLLFGISCRTAERRVKNYARMSDVEDWKLISPHRLRAYFATDLQEHGQDSFTIRNLMRHKNIQTTNLYVGPTSATREEQIIESLD